MDEFDLQFQRRYIERKQVDLFFNLLNNADEKTLMMSLDNCHIEGLTSIVLKKEADGSLLRAFLSQAHLSDNRIGASWDVGFHNHKYDIDISLISGDVYNVTAKESFENDPASHQVYRYKFNSYIDGKKKVRQHSSTNLKILKSELLSVKPIHLSCDALHTIYIPLYAEGAWFVKEGPKVRDYADLYTNSQSKMNYFSADDLYIEFEDVEQIKKHCRKFFNGLVTYRR
jgi:hypothetical protein